MRITSRIDPDLQRKWELKILKQGLEYYDHSGQGELTKEEMESALFYFLSHAYVMMVHFENNQPKLRF